MASSLVPTPEEVTPSVLLICGSRGTNGPSTIGDHWNITRGHLSNHSPKQSEDGKFPKLRGTRVSSPAGSGSVKAQGTPSQAPHALSSTGVCAGLSLLPRRWGQRPLLWDPRQPSYPWDHSSPRGTPGRRQSCHSQPLSEEEHSGT